jgi:nitrous oxidase accessory protein
VSPSGPLATVPLALAQASPGDTILVKPGTYHSGNIIIKIPITILGKGYPVFDGDGKFEIFTVAAPDVTLEGLKIIHSGSGSIEDVAGIKAIQSRNLRVINNQFENTFFGIYLANCRGALVAGNTLSSNPESPEIGNGIHAWKCDSIQIKHNIIHGHRDGIYFEFVTHSRIEGNTSYLNMRYGLHFMFSHHDTYVDNTFRENGAGVAVMYTQGVTMINNHFQDNRGSASYGLLLKDIRDSFVEKNTFSGNTIGVYMEGSSRCAFDGNTWSNNGWAVKMQANCDGNIFRMNNFLGNTFDVATNGSLVLNILDHNYWDRYEGYDINQDGIGDIPFHPVSLYSMVVEKMPAAVMLWRSFLVQMLDKTEKVIPSVTPVNMIDAKPSMKHL